MNRRLSIQLLAGALLRGGPVGYNFRSEPGRVLVLSGDTPYTTFHYGPELDRPCLYPIVTPSGLTISRGVPPGPSETQDHAWHRGIWYGHGDISGADFWRERVDKETGKKLTARMIPQGTPRLDEKAGSISLRLALTAADGNVIGSLAQRYRFLHVAKQNAIDASVALIADKGRDLVMGDSDDGGLAIRLSDDFREDRGAALVNSAGQRGTKAIWGKPATWVDFTAAKDGKTAGAAMFDHPGNFRYPTGWHARGYGLNSANPFALGSFSGEKPPIKGRHTIPAGKTLQFNYRVLVHDGALSMDELNALQAEFAHSRPSPLA